MAIATAKSVLSTLMNWMTFTDDARQRLVLAEERLLEACGLRYKSKFVQVRFKQGSIYTLTSEPEEGKPSGETIVLIPDIGAGVAMYAGLMKAISESHTIHIFEPLGFGRSDRVNFNADNAIAELEMVETIDDWRREMGIDKMYLMGHGFGGYLASAYALEHPTVVSHLFPVDPWGFAEKVEANEKMITPYPWMDFLGDVIAYFNPLTPMRWLGPLAPAILQRLRPDFLIRFPGVQNNDIYKYVYYLNLATPTGENAFMNMTIPVGWPKRPMIRRFCGIDRSVGTTFVYGSKSWIDPGPAMDIQQARDAYVEIHNIRGAGHYVYADAPTAFKSIVLDVVEGRFEMRAPQDAPQLAPQHEH